MMAQHSVSGEVTQRRVAIITGGSRGIGAAICRHLAANHSVHLVYRDADDAAERVVQQINAAGGRVVSYKTDISVEHEVQALVDNILARESAIHVLVNNAAIIDDRLLALTTLKRWEHVLRVNLTGPFLMCRAVLPVMLERAWGRIINISSNSVRIPGAGQSAYAASKGGLEALTRALAMEVGRKGIRVNSVAPGRVKTDMTQNVAAQLGAGDSGPRWGVPEDLSGIVGFLASDQADYIQGQTITVDGGRLVMRSAKG
jgi:3-oxoacyl-[acyl-carrier protein] reductase